MRPLRSVDNGVSTEPEGRYVVEIPIRWSATDERTASRRLWTVQRLENEVLAHYLRAVNAYRRDPAYQCLVAERREAQCDGRLPAPKRPAKGAKAKTRIPESVTPRRYVFAEKEERWAAWRALQQRYDLFGEQKVASLTDAGRAVYEARKAMVKALTARQRDLGPYGLDAATIHHIIVPDQRARVLKYLGLKKVNDASGRRILVGRPRFASRRNPRTSVTFSSATSSANIAGFVVDIAASTATWKAARGGYPIVARLRWPKADPWIRKAASAKIAQVRLLHRVVKGKRRWYVQIVVKGMPPINRSLKSAIAMRPSGQVGIDVGSRHVAVVGPEAALLADFAPTMMQREIARDADVIDVRDGDRVKKDRWYRRLQERISRQRNRNPRNRDTHKMITKTLKRTRDGKAVGKSVEIEAGFKKGARLATSKRVQREQTLLADVARADAAARANDHGRLVNHIAGFGDSVLLERLSYVAWQRSFGRSVRRYAPGSFEALLRRRAPLLALGVLGVETSAKLSQLCHACGTFEKAAIRGPIATRMKSACACGREAAQRDLYSAFLARFVGEDSSVDLQAASAAWSGAFGLLRGAQSTYDKAQVLRLVRGAGGGSRDASTSAPDVPLSPAAIASDRQLDQPNRSTPTSVRDAGVREIEEYGVERVGGSDATQARSNLVLREPLPPSEACKRRRRARAEPPLENCRERSREIEDS